MRKDIQDLWNLVEPHVNDAGFDLIEVQSGREAAGWVVRLYIDRMGAGQGSLQVEAGLERDINESLVSLEDCERVSRDVSAALDVADLITHAYQLEVSSPGLDRPLRRAQDFARFVGLRAKVRLNEGVEGRRNFSGVLLAVEDGRVEIDCDGRSYQFPVEDVAKANLVPDWAETFRRSAS